MGVRRKPNPPIEVMPVFKATVQPQAVDGRYVVLWEHYDGRLFRGKLAVVNPREIAAMMARHTGINERFIVFGKETRDRKGNVTFHFIVFFTGERTPF